MRQPEDGTAGLRHPVDDGLLGSWSATRWQYISRASPVRTVDLICDLGGVVTLSLSAGTYVVTLRDGRSVGGRCEVHDDRLELMPEGNERRESMRFRVVDETLSLSAEGAAWDFAGDGNDEAADFVAVLVRL